MGSVTNTQAADGAAYPSFTSGSIPFAGSDGRPAQDNANLAWDDTNNRLGINISSPSCSLHIAGSSLLGGYGVDNVYFGIDSTELPRIGFSKKIGFEGMFMHGNASSFQIGMCNASNIIPANYSVISVQFCLDTTGKLGLNGVTSPTKDLSFGGNSARTIWLERHTTANTTGNSLTIQAGGATSGATDKAGGQLILGSGKSTGTGEGGVTLQGMVAGSTGTADNSYQDMIKILGNKLGFFNVTPVVRPTALTTQLTTITHTEPGTPDYAFQDMTAVTPWGFASQDEGNTLLKVVKNLQTRMSEAETKLQALGLLT